MNDVAVETQSAGSRRAQDSIPPQRFERLAISASEAALALGCSVSTVYRMIRTGQLRSARSSPNGKIFVNLQSARDFVDGETRALEVRSEEQQARLA